MISEMDMSKHVEALGKFRSKALLMKDQFNFENLENKLLVLKTTIKCADIGHSAKDWDLH